MSEDLEEDEHDADDWIDIEPTPNSYHGTLIRDDEWEDLIAYLGIKAKYPDAHILKVVGYHGEMLKELDQWLRDNCKGEFKRIGCVYTVAVVLHDPTDAILYRLRWQGV